MKRKLLSRAGWRRVLAGTSIVINTYDGRYDGYAAATFIDRVREALVTSICGRTYTVAGDGFIWIQRLPAGAHWSLTTMYDARGNIVQWYFDIIKQSGLDENGQPFYDDLYLDIVTLPSGGQALLDADELQAALDSGGISQADYGMAWAEARQLMGGMAGDVQALTDMARADLAYFQALRPMGTAISHP